MLMFLMKGLVFHVNFQVTDISFNFIIFQSAHISEFQTCGSTWVIKLRRSDGDRLLKCARAVAEPSEVSGLLLRLFSIVLQFWLSVAFGGYSKISGWTNVVRVWVQSETSVTWGHFFPSTHPKTNKNSNYISILILYVSINIVIFYLLSK